MITLNRVEMAGFLVHKKTGLDFPKRGVLLVTGENGSGKSSIPEGIAVALWGKTLRGTDPWAGDVGSVFVNTDRVDATRTRKGSRTSLNWALSDATDGSSYETTTKAQEALEQVVGSFDVWRRTSVFSSSDAMHFSLATDAERKRLLEEILGIERFDVALDRCRSDLKGKVLDLSGIRGELSDWESRLAERKTRQSDARVAMEKTADPIEPTPPEMHEAQLASWKTEATELEKHVAAALADLRRLADEHTLSSVYVTSARKDVQGSKAKADLLSGGRCPSCEQAIPQELRTRLAGKVTETAALLELAERKCREEQERIASERTETEAEHKALSSKLSARRLDMQRVAQADEEARKRYVRERQLFAEAAEQRAGLEKRLKDASAAVLEAADKAVGARERVAAAEREVTLLEAVEQVLGLRGVRAHVLGRALKGLEAVANAWLDRLSGGEIRTRIRPYVEKKTGGVSDAISIEVTGPWGDDWKGYRATSQGQRRRLDIAFLMALGEVSRAASGVVDAGTIFFDEVFDALDDAGVDSMVEALHALAHDRLCVVITHSKYLVSRVRADAAWHVEDGHVRLGA